MVTQADATKGLRQHPRVAAGDDRVGEEQITGLQLGIEGAHLQSPACGGERARRFAVAIADRQDARTVGPASAIEFQAEHGMGIDAEADRAFGVARLEYAEKTLTPLDIVVRLLQAVAIHVVVAGVEVEARACDEALLGRLIGVDSGGNRCGNCNEQRGEAGRVKHVRWSSLGQRAALVLERLDVSCFFRRARRLSDHNEKRPLNGSGLE